MNPLTNIKNQAKLNERELSLGIAGEQGKSWHQKYKNSAWIYVGGLPYDLSEGDIICVFSQYGEVVNINLIRDRKTGKSKGFCFLCYEDQRSTVLSVDNFNGVKLLSRTIRVDHVEEYRVPKLRDDTDPEISKIWKEGCAPKPIAVIEDDDIPPPKEDDTVLPLPKHHQLPVTKKVKDEAEEEAAKAERKAKKKEKKEKRKEKKRKKKEKKKRRRQDSSSSDSSDQSPPAKQSREEDVDFGRPGRADASKDWRKDMRPLDQIKREKGAPMPAGKFGKPKGESKSKVDWGEDYRTEDEPDHQAPFMDWRDVRRMEERYLGKGAKMETETDRWKLEIYRLERAREKRKMEEEGVAGYQDDKGYLPKRYNR